MEIQLFSYLEMVTDVLLNPIYVLSIFLATFMGLIFGAMPGLTATMGVALLLPVTFTLPEVQAIGMMIGVYVGGIAGGAISAILLNIPGTPSSVVTTLDGYPMAKKGKASQALGWAITASFFGGFISWLILVTVAPQLAKFALRFGPPEYAALALFGLTIIASITAESIAKGIFSGLIGLWLAVIGIDPIIGNLRFTFNSVNLMGGIGIMPALIGFFAIPQILQNLTQNEVQMFSVGRGENAMKIIPTLASIWYNKINLIRSSIIGTFVGMIPAAGGNIGSFLAYDQAKRFSKNPNEFGEGNIEGVIASEAANNGVTGGALIPLLALGIPGDSPTAVLLGALMIHGLQPGPQFFTKNPNLAVGLFTLILLANIFMMLIQYFGIRVFVQILKIPLHFLAPLLVILSIIGSYALRNNFFDIWVTLILGLFGYVLVRGKFPMAPIVLGLILGPMLESQIRRSLIISGGDWSIFFTRTISVMLIILSILVLITSTKIANKGKI